MLSLQITSHYIYMSMQNSLFVLLTGGSVSTSVASIQNIDPGLM